MGDTGGRQTLICACAGLQICPSQQSFELEDKQEQVQASVSEKQSNESDVHNIILEAPDWETFVEDLFGKK